MICSDDKQNQVFSFRKSRKHRWMLDGEYEKKYTDPVRSRLCSFEYMVW